MIRFLVLFALGAACARAEIQFSGYFLTDSSALFTLEDTEGPAHSDWLKVGDSFHGCTVKGFDRDNEVLSIEKDRKLLQIGLKEPKVKAGRIKVFGTITFLPGNHSEGIHTSLILGEDEAFSLAHGVTLHVRAERLPDGSMLYHARFVTRDDSGTESTDILPDTVTPPGGEFAVRNTSVGFSFKP